MKKTPLLVVILVILVLGYVVIRVYFDRLEEGNQGLYEAPVDQKVIDTTNTMPEGETRSKT